MFTNNSLGFKNVLRRYVSTTTIFNNPPPNLSTKQMSKLSTTDLLIKLGYISQPNAGLTHWLPLGKETLYNISKIICKHHDNAGCTELSLSSISHGSLWNKTNRWSNNELFKIGEYCLAATAEEEITNLVKDYLKTYKKLPFIGYQLNRKYRNEKRARGGLLRGREFLMKDAYSFDSNSENALISFNKINEVYENIFNELRVPWVKANADSGDIGGDLSYEWHIVSDIGEDVVVECDDCSKCGNTEKVKSIKTDKNAEESNVSYYLTTDGELVCIYYPMGRKLSLKFVKDEELIEFNEKIVNTDEVIETFKKNNEENDGLLNIYRIVDLNVGPGTTMPDLPVGFSRSRMITFEGLDITESQTGDQCPSCETGHLIEKKGVEVGHTFYLGTKYSKPLEAEFVDKDGEKKLFEMGCYGIGVSRLVGTLAEILRDEQGLRWPSVVAPLQVSVIKGSELELTNEEEELSVFNKFIKNLKNEGITLEVDESDISFGKKLSKSKTLGIPLQVIAGKLMPLIEIEVRGIMFSEEWEELFELNKGEWNWQVEKFSGIEKHIVDVEHAHKVIKALLKDM